MFWYLECRSQESRLTTSIPLPPLPFRVGRRWDLPLVLSSPLVSWEHAEISQTGDGLEIRDLGSTNGTFINGRRIEDAAPLAEGDLLHFAVLEFRLGRAASYAEISQPTADLRSLPPSAIEEAVHLSEMIRGRAAETLFQPVAGLRGQGVLGFEALGRGCHARLPKGPADLLRIAQRLGAAAELSQVFRICSIEAARQLPPGSPLFANTHPAEIQRSAQLIRGLRDVREREPGLQLILEVHESAVADLGVMRTLRAQLHELGIQLAYDDFGAGQSRLLELGEVPPDILKFDAALIRGLEQAPATRHAVISSLLRTASGMGIVTVAEGVETRKALDTCREIGFDAAQGYFCGRPAPASTFALEETQARPL